MFLVAIKGTKVGSTYLLSKIGPIVIGRDKGCDISILDIMISRKHCQIERRNNNFFLTDLHSRNNTKLNGKTISGPEMLKIGDILDIGSTRLLFTDQEEIPIKSVADFDMMRKSQTRNIDLSNSWFASFALRLDNHNKMSENNNICLLELTTTTDHIKSEMIKNALKDNGIECILQKNATSSVYPFTPLEVY